MGILPTIKDIGDSRKLATVLEQWRQRLQALLPNEREFVGEVRRTFFSTIDAKTVRMHFDPGSNADAHDIEWSNDPNFKNSKSMRVHGGKDGAARAEIPLFDGFTCVNRYYFRVRAIKNGTAARWSPTASFGVPIPGALLDLYAVHAVNNVTEELQIINVVIVLPRTALQGAQTILDPESVWTDHVDLEADWSALAGAIDAAQTTFTVTAGQGPYFKVAGYYKIEDEIVLVDGVAGDVVTVQRGVNDTVAAPHADLTTVRFYARVLREMFTAGNNGTFSVIVTIPNTECVRMRTFQAWPVNRCGERGPMSEYALDLPPPALVNDLVAEPFFQRVVLRWSELPWTAYRYQIFHSTTVPIPIANLDPTLTAGVELLARPLADHEGEATFVHDIVFQAGVVHFYGVRAIDICGGYNLPTGGDTVGPLQPDEHPENPAGDVTGITATEGPACVPHSIRSRARPTPMSSVTVGWVDPVPIGTFARVKIYLQMVGQQAQLNGAITSGAGTMLVEPYLSGGAEHGGTSRMWGGRYYQIDSEVIRVLSITGMTVNISRGQFGTAPAAHSDNAPIYPYIAPEFTGAEGPDPPLGFLYSPIGMVTLYFVSVSTSGEENQILSSPNLTIDLDGVTSPPLEVQNLYCQTREHGVQLSWSEGLECDLDHYDVADMGNVTMLNQADILARHIVARVPAVPGNPDRVYWNWVETEYEGSMSGGGATIVFPENHFEPDAHNGKSWTFSYINPGTPSTTEYTILDTTPNTIVLSSVPAESGAAAVRGYVGGRRHKFYVRAVNQADLASEWRPVEGTFLECSPLAPDGSYDIGVPAEPWSTGIVSTVDSFASVAPNAGSYNPGQLSVFVVVRAKPELDTDFNTALKQNIGGVNRVEVRVRHSNDGVINLADSFFTFPIINSPDNYFYDAAGAPVSPAKWIWRYQLPPIDLPGQGIDHVNARVHNWFGWGPFRTSNFPFLSPPGGGPFFTGNRLVERQASETPDVSNNIYPNLARSSRLLIANLAANANIQSPEYRSSGGTKGGGQALLTGEIFTVTLEQDGTGGKTITFAVAYKGLDGKEPDLRPNRYTTWQFEVVTSSYFRCIGYLSGSK